MPELMDSNLPVAEVPNSNRLSKEKNLGRVEYTMDSIQIFVYSVVFMLGILGNGLVIWITGFKMQKTVNSIWFLNLAVADFLFSASRIIPLVKHIFSYWPLGEFLCRATSFLKYLNMFCSMFLLASISLDRCTSVVLPIWSRNNRQPRLAWLVSGISWIGAVVASVPFYIFRGLVVDSKNRTKCSVTLSIQLSKDRDVTKQVLYLHRFTVGFLIPFLVILMCYLIITVKLKQKSLTKSKKPFLVILAIIVTFFICWMPYHLFLLLKLIGVKGLAMTIGSPLTSCLIYLNSCINPVLYFFMGLDFKKKLNQSLLAIFKHALLDDVIAANRRRWDSSTVDRVAERTVTVS